MIIPGKQLCNSDSSRKMLKNDKYLKITTLNFRYLDRVGESRSNSGGVRELYIFYL